MDLTAILQAVRASGFSGWYELEIFSDDGTLGTTYADSLWKWPPRDLLGAGRDGFANAWRASLEADRR
jgi:sugar phosphate isomerase/epimerase